MNNPLEIVLLSGIPNAGKSSYRNKKEFENYIVICRDDIRDLIFGNEKKYVYTKENEDKVSSYCNTEFNLAVKLELNIIIDACHTKEIYLQEWIKKRPSNYNLRVVFFDIPLWKAYSRNVIRWIMTGKFIPFKVMNNMKRNFDKINKKKYESIHL